MSESSPEAARRIVALVLPELLVELALAASPARARGAWGVVLVDAAAQGENPDEPLRPTATLDAVNAAARRCGVRAGQTITEARALIAGFEVERLPPAAVEQALAAIAEVSLGFGATVALRVPDTVWVDVSGSAHLFGGEEALVEELVDRVRALGYGVRAAVAPGPELARAVARWAPPKTSGKGAHFVPAVGAAQAVQALPVVALPLSEECHGFLVRLGVLTLGDLAALPRSSLTTRLSGEVGRALDLAVGLDPTPLIPYQLPETVVEELGFEYGVDGSEPLLFALRGIAARVAARLAGRGMAAERLVLSLGHDRPIARLRGEKETTELRFALSSPLTREDDIRRVVAARLERARLPAPTLSVRLEVPVMVSAVARQLELGQTLSGGVDLEKELPLVVAEIAADVGEERVGVLQILDAHRLEARSTLAPAFPEVARRVRSKRRTTKSSGASVGQGRTPVSARGPGPRSVTPLSVHVSGTPLNVVEGASDLEMRAPLTRLLPEPVRFDGALRVGSTIAFERSLYTIESLRFEHRLHAVEWWNGAPITRDYIRVWLKATEGVIEAVVYVDRASGKRYLQAVAD
ncbi:MAG TPA: DNA polymerase Y family protein [Polyangiaceae bacterium]|jgi:protein ImuB|nr:DNA polymerase Y family protein [Polyangiaceae bacterium]